VHESFSVVLDMNIFVSMYDNYNTVLIGDNVVFLFIESYNLGRYCLILNDIIYIQVSFIYQIL
jgi:hypothetical protein